MKKRKTLRLRLETLAMLTGAVEPHCPYNMADHSCPYHSCICSGAYYCENSERETKCAPGCVSPDVLKGAAK